MIESELDLKKSMLRFWKKQLEEAEKYRPEFEKLEREIAELEKPKPSEPLSFLELATKHDHPFTEILKRSESYLGWICQQAAFTRKEARKLVAEIYLTLLAKELNGNSVINFRNGSMLKYYIAYSHTNNCPVINDHLINDAGILYFATKEIAEQALTYSEESKLMFNWYFGIEEGKQ